MLDQSITSIREDVARVSAPTFGKSSEAPRVSVAALVATFFVGGIAMGVSSSGLIGGSIQPDRVSTWQESMRGHKLDLAKMLGGMRARAQQAGVDYEQMLVDAAGNLRAAGHLGESKIKPHAEPLAEDDLQAWIDQDDQLLNG